MSAPDAGDPLPTMGPEAASPPGTPNAEPPARPIASLAPEPAPAANAAATLPPATPSLTSPQHAVAERQSSGLSGPVSVTGLVLRWQEACERSEAVSVAEVCACATGDAGRGTATH